MSRYKKKVICPTDNTRLGWEQLVETRANNTYTYHCKECDTYWHTEWYKHYSDDMKRWNWDYRAVWDDFGNKFVLLSKV